MIRSSGYIFLHLVVLANMAYAARINSLINEEIEDSLSSIDSNDDRDEDYGNKGCRVFKWGLQN